MHTVKKLLTKTVVYDINKNMFVYDNSTFIITIGFNRQTIIVRNKTISYLISLCTPIICSSYVHEYIKAAVTCIAIVCILLSISCTLQTDILVSVIV